MRLWLWLLFLVPLPLPLLLLLLLLSTATLLLLRYCLLLLWAWLMALAFALPFDNGVDNVVVVALAFSCCCYSKMRVRLYNWLHLQVDSHNLTQANMTVASLSSKVATPTTTTRFFGEAVADWVCKVVWHFLVCSFWLLIRGRAQNIEHRITHLVCTTFRASNSKSKPSGSRSQLSASIRQLYVYFFYFA